MNFSLYSNIKKEAFKLINVNCLGLWRIYLVSFVNVGGFADGTNGLYKGYKDQSCNKAENNIQTHLGKFKKRQVGIIASIFDGFR